MNAERWREIDLLYHAAVERAPDERGAFLDDACGGDVELRDAVEKLIAGHEQAGSFLVSPAWELAARGIAAGDLKEANILPSNDPGAVRGPWTNTIGRIISHYRIGEPLGEGGMGIVYRAVDTRLNRPVALKVLPSEAMADAERSKRFIQEAKAASALNHPHIITVYEVDSWEGIDFIAMEYVEGMTLQQLVGRKGLKLRDALKYSAQIADALAAAHRVGIVHRDLKPANVMITERGDAKVLDFGLAKLTERAGLDEAGPSQTARADEALRTEEGMILGTVAYMSPEQAEGKKVDARADIFAFGALLYEMITGQRAFQGETKVSTLSALLHAEPRPASEVVKGIPREVDRIIAHCLRKDPDRRFQHLDDVKTLLEQLQEESDSGKLVTPPRPSAAVLITSCFRSSGFWIGTAALLVTMTVVLGWFSLGRAPAITPGVIRFSIPPPEKTAFTRLPDIPYSVAVSPDGQRLALIVMTEGRTQLWVRSLGGLAAQPLAGTEGAGYPFWSPDSRYIGFFADGKLKKIDAGGGSPQTLCDAPRWGTAATWNREGVVLFSTSTALYRVSADGGQPMPVRKPGPAGEEYFWPSFLPDGRHFLFLTGGRPRDLYVGLLDSAETQLLVRDASRAAYAPPGYLLYVRDGTLIAHPFDARALRFTGEPIVTAEGLWFFKPTGTADYSVSESGVLIYRVGTSVSRLTWLDRRGAVIGSVGAPRDYQSPRISPDGQSVAVSVADPRTGTTDVWTYELSRGQSARVTFESGMENAPLWSPDGRWIVVAADVGGPPHLYQKTVNETGVGEPLVPLSGWIQSPDDWTPDGRFIIYDDGEGKSGEDLMILPLEGDRKPKPFLRTQFNEVEARFSPDGQWVAYVSDESGRPEVYVRPFADAGQGVRRQVSTAGGASPRWRRDGKELFFIAPDKNLTAVPVRTGVAFEAATPTTLFRVDARGNDRGGYDYDVTADGQRFLINTSIAEANLLPLTTVVNWTRDLKP